MGLPSATGLKFKPSGILESSKFRPNRIRAWKLPVLPMKETSCFQKRFRLAITRPILGIDVDSKYLVVHLLLLDGTNRARQFKNGPAGFRELVGWLAQLNASDAIICMEATGRYGEKLAKHCHGLGFKVVVANPNFISRHKESLNKHNKTDPTDALAIADYARCFEGRLRAWEPLSPVREKLRDVLGQIAKLKKARTMFSNRNHCGLNDVLIRDSNNESIAFVSAQIDKLSEYRDSLFEELPALKVARAALMQTVGIGKEIATALVVRVKMQNFASGRELGAFLGCASAEWSSGKQKRRGRQPKAGDSDLRSLLRLGAASALRTSFYRDFVDRLTKKGLSKGQVIGAVARKMLLIAHAVLRSGKPFDRNYQSPLAT